MKYLDLPLLGTRPATEFVVAGVLEPEPAQLGSVEAGDWVFNRMSVPMQRTEWWYHTPSQLWFIVERDTETDAVSRIILAGDDDAG